MQRRNLFLIALGALPFARARAAASNETDAASGIRAALERGATAAVGLLGVKDGFLGNAQVKIELPDKLKSAAKLLKATGQGRKVDELITAMNRAAEAAVPAARPLLVNAIKSMSVEDGLRLLKGGDNAATQFFESKTRAPLAAQFLPIVTKSTEKLAVAEKYNAVAGKAAGFGLIKKEDANVQQYVTARALDGLFLMIGEEEKKIRKDPVGTGSALLKKVFGGL
ncbi:MAG TPA: DUF4197 domain-containing protein [Burkholderiaceae bacterium]